MWSATALARSARVARLAEYPQHRGLRELVEQRLSHDAHGRAGDVDRVEVGRESSHDGFELFHHRADELAHDDRQGFRRVGHLPLHQEGRDRRARRHHLVEHGADPLPEHGGRLPGRQVRELRRVRGGAALAQLVAHATEVGAEDLQVEVPLRAEVVVAGRQVDPGALGDLPHRRAVEALGCEQRRPGLEEAGAGLVGGPRRHEQAFQTDVRSSQAAAPGRGARFGGDIACPAGMNRSAPSRPTRREEVPDVDCAVPSCQCWCCLRGSRRRRTLPTWRRAMALPPTSRVV